MEKGDFVPLPSGNEGSYNDVSSTCVERLTDDVGIIWETFGETPTEIAVADTNGRLVVSGLYVILTSDVGSVEQLMNQGLPSELSDYFDALMEEGEVASEDPAGALWWLFVRSWVQSVYYDSLGGSCSSGAYLFYDSVYDETIGVCDIISMDMPVIHAAASLIHESSHGIYPEHDANCPPRPCDTDPEGAYGVEAVWLADWLRHNSQLVALQDCSDAVYAQESICSGIMEHDGYTPCEGLDDICL